MYISLGLLKRILQPNYEYNQTHRSILTREHQHSNAEVTASTTVAQALVDTGLCSSLSEARRAIAQGGVAVNNEKVLTDDETLEGRALAGGAAVLRRGKKTLAGVRFPAA